MAPLIIFSPNFLLFLSEVCWGFDRSLSKGKQTNNLQSWQTDSNANRQRKAMMETEAESTTGCREWSWPELCLFWFPLLVCTGLGLLQRFSNHVRIFLWVWRARGVHYCQNSGDYTQKHTHKKRPFIPIYNNYIWLFKLSRPPHQMLTLKKYALEYEFLPLLMHVHCSFYLTATGLKICLAAGSLTPFIWALISFLLANYCQTEIINTRLIKKQTCSDVANRLQSNVKYKLERGETETKRLEPGQNVIQVSCN